METDCRAFYKDQISEKGRSLSLQPGGSGTPSLSSKSTSLSEARGWERHPPRTRNQEATLTPGREGGGSMLGKTSREAGGRGTPRGALEERREPPVEGDGGHLGPACLPGLGRNGHRVKGAGDLCWEAERWSCSGSAGSGQCSVWQPSWEGAGLGRWRLGTG